MQITLNMFEFFLSNGDNTEQYEAMKNAILLDSIGTYIIHFPANYQNSKIIRDFVGEIFEKFFITHPWKSRFILITDELVNNSIEHGSESEDINRCEIVAGRGEDDNFHITLEVHDTGKKQKQKFDSREFEAIRQDRVQNENNKQKEGIDGEEIYMEKRGRGLFHITEKVVDKLSFSESPIGGVAVKIEKCIATHDTNDCKETKHD